MANTWYEKPKQKIVIGSSTITTDCLSSIVTRRENGIDDALIVANDDTGKTFISIADVGDLVKIWYKYEDGNDTWTLVFEGNVKELNPELNIEGEVCSIKAYQKGIALQRSRVKGDYGTESTHPGTSNLYNITQTLLIDYVNKVMGDVSSGYSIQGEYIASDPNTFKYLLWPFAPVTSCLKDMCDLISAQNYVSGSSIDPGVHWIVLPVNGTMQLCMGTIGAHGGALETYWPSYHPKTTLTIGDDTASSQFSKKEMEANYVIVFGKYEIPADEVWTEGNSDDWYEEDCVVTDSAELTPQAGTCELLISTNSFPFIWGETFYSGWGAMNVDVTKIGSRTNIPTIEFYAAKVTCERFRVYLFTGAPGNNNFFYKEIQDSISSDSAWKYLSFGIGPWAVNEGWQTNGTPSWSDIDYVGFGVQSRLVGASYGFIDDLHISGTVVRAAYHSTKVSQGAKVKLICDSLARSDSLDASDDSGTVAQLAKVSLIKDMTEPFFGKIVTPLDETVLAGQLVRIKNPRNVNFPVDTNQDYYTMRILEVQHRYTISGTTTQLTLTDDLKNSYPIHPTDAYNAIMKATNPDFQTRDRANLKGRDIDIFLTVLAKNYA